MVWGRGGRGSDFNTDLSQLSVPSDRRFGGEIVGVEVDVVFKVVWEVVLEVGVVIEVVIGGEKEVVVS